MEKLKYKLMTFMQGRYGPDDLYKGSLVLYLILLVANVFFSSKIISILLSLLLVITLFRFFSKNISARQRENAKYLIMKRKFLDKFSLFKKRFSDKDHVYKKCPHCHAQLRFPRKKGRHNAFCPKCQKQFHVNVRF